VPVEPGHVQVKEYDRGLFGGDPGESGLPIACLADDELEPLIIPQCRRHPVSKERLIVDDQNPNDLLGRKRFLHELRSVLAPARPRRRASTLTHLSPFFKSGAAVL